MHFVLRPWQLFFVILSGSINRQQQEIIGGPVAVEVNYVDHWQAPDEEEPAVLTDGE